MTDDMKPPFWAAITPEMRELGLSVLADWDGESEDVVERIFQEMFNQMVIGQIRSN